MKKSTGKLGRFVVASAVALLTAVPSIASANWFSCQPTQVLDNVNRIGVRCSNTISLNGNTVRYVTFAKTDAETADRFTSMAQAALLSGKIFYADIPVSSSTNISGCLASDCRTAGAFGLKD